MAIKKTSEKNVVCVKTLVAHPQHIDKVQRLCQELLNSVQPCRADRLSQSGLLAFECSNDRWDSNVFHFWERYESNVAMGRFNNRDDMQRFMSNVQEYLEKPVGMVLYEWRDGHMGAACIQGGARVMGMMIMCDWYHDVRGFLVVSACVCNCALLPLACA